METATRYFVLPGRYATVSPLLVKFDSDEQYWYWQKKDKSWILVTTLFKKHWLDGHLTEVTEEKRKRIIEDEAPNVFKIQ
jgi:hypothetical protein